MNQSRGIDGLNEADKSKLIADLKARAKAKSMKAAEAEPAPAAATAKAFDFTNLSAHKQLRMMRALGDMTGIADPFFKLHDGIPGGTIRTGSETHVNFGTYNYVGLNGDARVMAAAKDAIDRYGTSVSASRVVAGERPFHGRLEAALARFTGTEAALAFVSGHATNVSTIGCLMGPKDLILADCLAHNSIVEGARLSGATRAAFPHNDLEALEHMLARSRDRHERVLIAVEGLYSMDGDCPDLARLVDLKTRFGAWLMVDEAHAAGVLGASGRGIAEEQGVDPRAVEIWMGTLSKAFASAGGYIAGAQALIDVLKAGAPGFVFSVGLSPAQGAAALQALEIIEAEPDRVARLRANGRTFLAAAKANGLDTGTAIGASVVPVIVGDSSFAVALSNRLSARGISVLPIIFPAVPEKQARLRFFITCEHTEQQLVTAANATAEEFAKLKRGT
ncbi:MAG: aminotransferase class I/II-fold pyridoxal phosphate-dependent enzyme [Ancalomicrobiaceae bacterium]|nr:aminotransferase class I/II-fold pyridoxal phosphate-dependent enzyme [Ancalomicrobiaceae bacterium]